MPTEPLLPQEVDALLRPDPRSAAADMLVLRDALVEMGDALERLASAVGQLQQVVADVERLRNPGIPPRAD